MADLATRRALAAIRAWYAPYPPMTIEPGDIDDMLAALAEPTAEAALVRWAYKATPNNPLDPEEVRVMAQAREAAGKVK